MNAWKNVLRRGVDAANYHRYLHSFYRLERQARVSMRQLHEQALTLPKVGDLTAQLVSTHLDLGRKVREALRVFNDTAINPGQVTDSYISGVEDKPSRLIKQITDQLHIDRDIQLAVLTERRVLHERILLTIVILVLTAAFSAFFG